MVTTATSTIRGFRTCVLTALLLATNMAADAQNHTYRATIVLNVGGAVVSGFLHSVNDSMMIVIPGASGKKGLKTALAHPLPISVRTSQIKKVIIARVRPAGHVFLSTMAVSAGYVVAYLALVPLEPTIGSLLLYGATVSTATIVTMLAIYTRKYKPTEPGFTIKMQKYCMVKTGIVADGS